MTRLSTVAAIALLAACSHAPQKQSAAPTNVPLNLNVHDNGAATPAPSPHPLPTMNAEQQLEVEWRDRGWSVVASDRSRLYMIGQSGLQAVRASDGSVVWHNANCHPVGATLGVLDDGLYTACEPGVLAVLNARNGTILRTTAISMHGVNTVALAGEDALAVMGWDDGATLVNRLVFLNRSTLKPLTEKVITDGTFLGVIAERAYIDDWCCNGRADEYRPATIYSISLRDGSQSDPVDLRPDPNRHSGRMQPLGQGEHNYMEGHYFYVPIGSDLYRYDVLRLQLPPQRTALATAGPQGASPPAQTAQ